MQQFQISLGSQFLLMGHLEGKHGILRAHWLNRSAAEFYRDKLHLDFPEIPVDQGEKLELKNADFYIVPSITEEELAASGLRILYRDQETGTTLLAPAI